MSPRKPKKPKADRNQAPNTAPSWWNGLVALVFSPVEWLRPRIGSRPTLIGVSLLTGFLLFLLWWNWEDVSDKPFVRNAIDVATRCTGHAFTKLPTASAAKPVDLTVLVPHVDGDSDGAIRDALLSAIRANSSVRVIDFPGQLHDDVAPNDSLRRVCTTPVSQVVERLRPHVILSARRTTIDRTAVTVRWWPMEPQFQERTTQYALSANNLPSQEFFTHLGEVIRLFVLNESAKVKDQEGTLGEKELEAIVQRLRSLLTNPDARWDAASFVDVFGAYGHTVVLTGAASGSLPTIDAGLSSLEEANRRLSELTGDQDVRKARLWLRLGQARLEKARLTRNRAIINQALAALKEADKVFDARRMLDEFVDTRIALAKGTLLQFDIAGEEEPDASPLHYLQPLATDDSLKTTHPRLWGLISDTLGSMALEVGRREPHNGSARFLYEVAENGFNSALEVRPREKYPSLWAATSANLAMTHCDASQRGMSIYEYKPGLTIANSVIHVLDAQRYPRQWARIHYVLGRCLLAQYEHTKDKASAARAADAMAAALVGTSAGNPARTGTLYFLGHALLASEDAKKAASMLPTYRAALHGIFSDPWYPIGAKQRIDLKKLLERVESQAAR